MKTFNLPDLGEGLNEAEIVDWHVSTGDSVVTGQPLLSVETDKAVVEIPAPWSGVIAERLANTGDLVQVGQPIVTFSNEKTQDAGAIVGEIDKDHKAAGDQATAAIGKRKRRGSSLPATPAARRLAAEREIDLSAIRGTGPEGVIQTSDILSPADVVVDGEVLRGVRRAMCKAMTSARRAVVPATVTGFADITDWPDKEAVMPRLVKAVVAACAAEPALNAWFDGEHRKVHSHVDLGIAVDTPEGLFTPVLRNAGNVENLPGALLALRNLVVDRAAKPSQLKGATITLSNFGSIAGDHAALVVMPPQVAILGTGQIRKTCIPRDGVAGIGKILPLSLTFDHRAVTGGEAARFLKAARDRLETKSSAGRS